MWILQNDRLPSFLLLVVEAECVTNMFEMFLCCCMKEKKKKRKYEKENNQPQVKERPATCTVSTPKATASNIPTTKLQNSKLTSEMVFTSRSPIFTLHRTTLPSVSTSSDDFCFYQVKYLETLLIGLLKPLCFRMFTCFLNQRICPV